MPITLEQAKQLTYGNYIYSNQFIYKERPLPKMWRINGQVKLWKRDPNRIQIPVKYGLYNHAYLCAGTISNKVYYYSTVLELENFELDNDKAIEILKEKGIIE